VLRPQIVSEGHDYDVNQLRSELNSAVDNFNTRGSGWLIDSVNDFTLIVTQYRPLAGLIYVATPCSIVRKHAVGLVNVKNRDDRCFQWAILSCLHPSKNNPCSVYSYTKYADTLNFDGIPFPVRVKDIPKFERQNPQIAVNVISLDEENNGYCVEYLSPEHNRPHHVDLLLIHDPDSKTSHYTWIKNFSRLLGGRTKHDGASFVCRSCLNVFSSQRVLDSHVPNCLQHAPQQTVYPDPEDCKLKFHDHDKEHSLKFYLVCDFESFLTPTDDDPQTKTRVLDQHNVSGYCCYRVTNLPQYQTPPTVYSGPDVMTHFYEHVISESEKINEILSQQIPLSPMSSEDVGRYKAATTCGNCNNPFTHQNYKIRHHDHTTGQFLFAACNNCNLQLKPKRCKTTNSYFLPIIFHNLKNYDSHFVIKHFQKQSTLRKKGHKVTYDDVKIIPLNGEQFIQFQIGNLKFLDSFQFLSTSLENLVSLLLKSGKQNFPHTTKYLGDNEFTFAKGVYPYNYMTDPSKFDETELPSIENFYNTLHDEPLSAEDYQRAQEIWKFYDIQNLRQYHDHYLKSDVLLLADVFEHFRRDVLEKHGLDCLYYPTLPSLAWSMALKHTKVELDLITDPRHT